MRVAFCTTKTLSQDYTESNRYQRPPNYDASSLFAMYTYSAKTLHVKMEVRRHETSQIIYKADRLFAFENINTI